MFIKVALFIAIVAYVSAIPKGKRGIELSSYEDKFVVEPIYGPKHISIPKYEPEPLYGSKYEPDPLYGPKHYKNAKYQPKLAPSAHYGSKLAGPSDYDIVVPSHHAGHHAGHHGYKPDYNQYDDAAPQYTYDYVVKDEYSGNHFGQEETRDGYDTKGSYHVLLPDGRTQTVTYYVSGDSGFVAEITYDGEAYYPEHNAYGHGPHKHPNHIHKAPYIPDPYTPIHKVKTHAYVDELDLHAHNRIPYKAIAPAYNPTPVLLNTGPVYGIKKDQYSPNPPVVYNQVAAVY